MGKVVTMVRARIAPERENEVIGPYQESVRAGLPPFIEETFLLRDDEGSLMIASIWRSREDLDAMLASGEEPFARTLLREAGGRPEAQFFDVIEHAKG